MRVVMRGHPRDRAEERGFTQEDVEAVVENYAYSASSKKGDATILYGAPRHNGAVLKVVLVGDPPKTDPYIVKTAAWRDSE